MSVVRKVLATFIRVPVEIIEDVVDGVGHLWGDIWRLPRRVVLLTILSFGAMALLSLMGGR